MIPTLLYKYLPEARLDILRTLKVRFTQPISLNDPFDCRPPLSFELELPGKVQSVKAPMVILGIVNISNLCISINIPPVRQIINPWSRNRGESSTSDPEEYPWRVDLSSDTTTLEIVRNLGIFSLSERWDSPLMWAHYCSNYQGAALGLDRKHKFFGHKSDVDDDYVPSFSGLRDYIYTGRVRYSKLRSKKDGDRSLESYLLKSKDWEYEREWRSLRLLPSREDKGSRGVRFRKAASIEAGTDSFGNPVFLYDLPASAIREVIFGLYTPPSAKAALATAVIENPELQHVDFFSICCSPETFQLDRIPLNKEELVSSAEAKYRASDFEEERFVSELQLALARLEREKLRILGRAVSCENFSWSGDSKVRQLFSRAVVETVRARGLSETYEPVPYPQPEFEDLPDEVSVELLKEFPNGPATTVHVNVLESRQKLLLAENPRYKEHQKTRK